MLSAFPSLTRTGIAGLSSDGLSSGPRAVAPAFAPTDIAGLQLWLDASDTATITQAANLVSQWNDKSGNARHVTQGTGANQPTTNIRTINARNVIDFDGTNDFFNISTPPSPASGQTFFFVFSNDTVTTARPLIGSNDTVAAPQVRTSTANLFGTVRTGVAALLNGSPAITTSTNYIGAANYSTTGNDVYINGTSYGTDATSTTFTNGSTWIGGAGATGATPFNFHDGVIGEVIIYSGNLSNADKNRVGNYLAAKWGITWTGL